MSRSIFVFSLLLAGMFGLWATVTAQNPLPSRITERKPGSVEGFSQPFRVIEVATVETGIIEKIDVREGQLLQKGDVLAKLDTGLHESQRILAEAGMQAHGEIEAAKAEFDLRNRRCESLERLLMSKHARSEEVERARTDLAIGKANLLAAEERRHIKELEYQRITRQIEQRTIRAPQPGWVTKVHKDQGEYLGPNDPVVCTIVQLDPLLVSFHLSRQRAKNFKTDSSVNIRFIESNKEVIGTVRFIAPLIEAESGTIPLHVVVPNADGLLQAGERCELLTAKTI